MVRHSCLKIITDAVIVVRNVLQMCLFLKKKRILKYPEAIQQSFIHIPNICFYNCALQVTYVPTYLTLRHNIPNIYFLNFHELKIASNGHVSVTLINFRSLDLINVSLAFAFLASEEPKLNDLHK